MKKNISSQRRQCSIRYTTRLIIAPHGDKVAANIYSGNVLLHRPNNSIGKAAAYSASLRIYYSDFAPIGQHNPACTAEIGKAYAVFGARQQHGFRRTNQRVNIFAALSLGDYNDICGNYKHWTLL